MKKMKFCEYDPSRSVTDAFRSVTDNSRAMLQNVVSLYNLDDNHDMFIVEAGNARGGSITIPLTSCLTGLD